MAPRSGCRLPAVAHAGRLQLKDATPDTKDLLRWSWLRGQATEVADFGDPVASDAYDLCIYDGVSSLLLHATAPAGGTCSGKPCWKWAGSTGFAYTDQEGSPDGLTSLRLKAGVAARANAMVKGKGANLAMPALAALTLPLRLQLQGGDGVCWETAFSAAQVDDANGFKARSD